MRRVRQVIHSPPTIAARLSNLPHNTPLDKGYFSAKQMAVLRRGPEAERRQRTELYGED